MAVDLATNLRAVQERIAAACARAGRDPDDVTLVAVGKTFPADTIRAMILAGHDVFGENRVQEALAKIDAVGPGPSWHLIGPLQRNKARHAVGRFALIHTVDSAKLAAELDKRAAAADLVQPVLIQVRQGGEDTKSGVEGPDLAALVDDVAARPHLDLRGLMTIPPPADVPEDNRRWFAELREMRDRETARSGLDLPHLSMGMTDDFEVAIEEGATLVRVGRALFGDRG